MLQMRVSIGVKKALVGVEQLQRPIYRAVTSRRWRSASIARTYMLESCTLTEVAERRRLL